MIQLIAFLGNYGREYENTRHNTAWLFASSLPFYGNLSWQSKFKSEFAISDDDTRHYYMKPMTYMNLSGDAIGEAAKFYKIPASDILVVHDEIELPLGTVSLKWSGGLGGHNGLRSTKNNLGTADFWRLRIGVGKPSNGNVADYVLGNFSSDESITLQQVFAMTNPLFDKLLKAKDPSNLIPEWGKKKLVD